jgi:hypothetical protein
MKSYITKKSDELIRDFKLSVLDLERELVRKEHENESEYFKIAVSMRESCENNLREHIARMERNIRSFKRHISERANLARKTKVAKNKKKVKEATCS